jgi:hypothetical protein
MNEVWIASKAIKKIVHILVGKHEGNIAESKRHILEDYIKIIINLLNPTGHVMHQQFNIQQL